jgi:hypothetical protein
MVVDDGDAELSEHHRLGGRVAWDGHLRELTAGGFSSEADQQRAEMLGDLVFANRHGERNLRVGCAWMTAPWPPRSG